MTPAQWKAFENAFEQAFMDFAETVVARIKGVEADVESLKAEVKTLRAELETERRLRLSMRGRP